jgi:hypothetical protein
MGREGGTSVASVRARPTGTCHLDGGYDTTFNYKNALLFIFRFI